MSLASSASKIGRRPSEVAEDERRVLGGLLRESRGRGRGRWHDAALSLDH
jgi:hypothetical protein